MQEHCRANYLQYPARFTEGNMLNPMNFKSLYCIYAFDVSNGDFALAGDSIVSFVHVRFRTKVKKDVVIHVTWISDRTCELYTDGKPLNIKTQADSYK